MTEPVLCPHCGSEIPAGSPAGLCPKCLVLAGLESEPAVAVEPQPTQSSPPAGSTGFIPATVEELAPRFPQLEIIALIGKGGMGAVYKARQPGLDRLVALKILPKEIGAAPAFAERFTREARALARLSHPNIVAVYDFGSTGDGLFYFIMEYVDGVNLRQALQSGQMNPKEALAIVPQICDALQFAHDEGLVHRDIKPENILINKRGRVKIADFGLAKLLGQNTDAAALTATQQVMGTLRYMAPEQMEGSHEVDHRADIYSLGVVFYELLTGELPIGRFAPPSKKVEIDVRLDEVVLRALEKEPEQRYQRASEVKTDVETIASGPAPLRPQEPLSKQSNSAMVSSPRLSRMAVVAALWAPITLTILTVALIMIAHREPPAQTQPPERAPSGAVSSQGVLQAPPSESASSGAVELIPLVLAPFGTTILGAVALMQIRHSAGRLYGLGLALFDVLLFPVVVIDLLIWHWILVEIGGKLQFSLPSHYVWLADIALPIVATLVIVVVDGLLIYGGWRIANAPLPGSSPSSGPSQTKDGF